MGKNKVLFNGKKTIAVFAGSMSSSYHEGIMRGASDVAEEEGYNIVIFAGGPLKSPDPLALSRDTLFELLDKNLFDGLIIPVSSHARFISESERDIFLNKYNSIPIVNVGTEINGYTNIVSNYETGIKEAVEHYVKVHNYKKIAFIRGPKNHENSDIKENIFKEQLLKNNLEFDQNLIIYSDLNLLSVKKQINNFFDSKGNLICDSIITCNDNQALGIMEAFIEKGYNIPNDIAITGSLNTLASQFSKPELNSIEEPKYEVGRAAAKALIRKIEGKEDIPSIHIPTKFILRKSCGCYNNQLAINKSFNNYNLSISDSSDQIFEKLLKRCVLIFKKNLCNIEELKPYILKFKQSLESLDFDEFLIKTNDLLNIKLKTKEINSWLSIISEIQYAILNILGKNESNKSLLKFMSNLVDIKNETERKSLLFQSFEMDYYINYFREIVNNLNSSFDLSSVKQYAMRILDLTELYISVYNFKNNKIDSVTNIISVRNSKLVEIPKDSLTHNPLALIPETVSKYNDRYTLSIYPLSFRKKPLGYIIFNLSNKKGSTYENMQAIISTALRNEMQILDLKKAEKRFSDIAHSTSNWLWETDDKNIFTYSSYSVIEVLGYTENEIIGMKLHELFVSENDNQLLRIKNMEQLKNVEVWFKHKNKNLKCLLLSAKPIMTDNVFSGYRGVFKDITEQKYQEEKINNLAYTDVLTGLPNRAKFQEELEKIIIKSKKSNQKFGLMFIDLDRFKYINDTMGHDSGDLLLVQVAKRLISATRSNDIVSRLGGDEFTIILPNITETNQVDKIAKRILVKLQPPVLLNNKPTNITLSLGVSIYPIDGKDSTTLLKSSDNAMYQAKSNGRNRYSFYDKILESNNQKRYKYEALFHSALKNNEFIIYFQPQIDTISKKILGAEVLVRISNPIDGIISPNHFIPIAEELNLTKMMDLKVLEIACKQQNSWKKRGYGDIRISLNLSAIQLNNDTIVSEYLSIIRKYDIDPHYIKFEITEYTIIENEELALEILINLKGEGFSIALDDFGTGYSSLSCINKYPIDTIKIDRSFIKDVITNKKNKAIIQSIIGLSKNLNMSIVAEGVETKDQYELMKILEVDEIQGFYFYKPLSAIEFEKHLFKNNF